jgi:hypothetical protein
MPSITKDEIEIGDNLTFSLYASVNGAVSYSGKVLGIVYPKVLPAGTTAPTDHVNLYPTLPQEVQAQIEDDWQSYKYLALDTDSGVKYFGLPWIIEGTLFRDDIGVAVVTLSKFKDSDAEAVRALLVANGYTVDSIQLS